MYKKTNSIWEINEDQFKALNGEREKLLFFVHYGTLAPSSHNSQPWEFSINNENTLITVSPSKERMLLESDVHMRQLYISLGCAVQNIAVAAEHYGYSTTVTCPSGTNQSVVLSLKKTDRKQAGPPLATLANRRTNRSAYTEEAISAIELPERLRSRVTAHFVSDQTKRNILADATLDAIDEAMKSKGFRRELSQYIIHNCSSSPVGMPGFTIGVPTLLSFVLPYLIKYLPPPPDQRKQNEKLLKHETSTHLVISTLKDTLEDWVMAGEAYEFLALSCTAKNIFMHPMAAGIEIGNFHQRIQTALGITTRPQFFARVGKTATIVRHSPRLPLTKVIS